MVYKWVIKTVTHQHHNNNLKIKSNELYKALLPLYVLSVWASWCCISYSSSQNEIQHTNIGTRVKKCFVVLSIILCTRWNKCYTCTHHFHEKYHLHKHFLVTSDHPTGTNCLPQKGPWFFSKVPVCKYRLSKNLKSTLISTGVFK